MLAAESQTLAQHAGKYKHGCLLPSLSLFLSPHKKYNTRLIICLPRLCENKAGDPLILKPFFSAKDPGGGTFSIRGKGLTIFIWNYLSIYRSTLLSSSIYFLIYLSLSLCLSIYTSIKLTVYLPLYPAICLLIANYLSVNEGVCPEVSADLSTCLSAYPSDLSFVCPNFSSSIYLSTQAPLATTCKRSACHEICT